MNFKSIKHILILLLFANSLIGHQVYGPSTPFIKGIQKSDIVVKIKILEHNDVANKPPDFEEIESITKVLVLKHYNYKTETDTLIHLNGSYYVPSLRQQEIGHELIMVWKSVDYPISLKFNKIDNPMWKENDDKPIRAKHELVMPEIYRNYGRIQLHDFYETNWVTSLNILNGTIIGHITRNKSKRRFPRLKNLIRNISTISYRWETRLEEKSRIVKQQYFSEIKFERKLYKKLNSL